MDWSPFSTFTRSINVHLLSLHCHFLKAYLEMTSKLNKYTVHFQLSSCDGGELTTADFNTLETKDLRNIIAV